MPGNNTESTHDPETSPLVIYENLVRDLLKSESLKLALEALVARIDWNKADPGLVGAAIQALSDDPDLNLEVEAWARSEHLDMCACCRAQAVKS